MDTKTGYDSNADICECNRPDSYKINPIKMFDRMIQWLSF